MARPASMPASSPCSPQAPKSTLIARMAAQEERHLKRFDALMAERRVRPTVLQPFWNVAGFALGAATALIRRRPRWPAPPRSRPRSTRIIRSSSPSLATSDPELAADIADFQADELDHREPHARRGLPQAIGYPVLTAAIRAGCRVAIGLSKRI